MKRNRKPSFRSLSRGARPARAELHGPEEIAGMRAAGNLGERSIEVRNVKQHPGGDGAVEGAARESEVLHVADVRLHSAGLRELHHSLRLIDRHNSGLQLSCHPLRELSLAAADLQDPLRADLGDCLEDDITRVLSLRRGMRPLSSSQPRLVRVLLTDDRRVVKRHGSTIGAPGSPRTPDRPPSHLFTVAPTSPNSPSCREPRAFRPST
mgnify:CR=1 FL=1